MHKERAVRFKRKFVRPHKRKREDGLMSGWQSDGRRVLSGWESRPQGGNRPAGSGEFEGNTGFIQGENRASMRREEAPTMTTGLARRTAKARKERTLRLTSLAHGLTQARDGRI